MARESYKGVRTPAPRRKGLGGLVESRRRSLGMTRQDLAKRVFIAPRTIRDLEEGRTAPARRTTGMVAAVLDLRPTEVAQEVGIEESAAAKWVEKGQQEINLRRELEELWAT